MILLAVPTTPPVDYNPFMLAIIVEAEITASLAEPTNPPALFPLAFTSTLDAILFARNVLLIFPTTAPMLLLPVMLPLIFKFEIFSDSAMLIILPILLI